MLCNADFDELFGIRDETKTLPRVDGARPAAPSAAGPGPIRRGPGLQRPVPAERAGSGAGELPAPLGLAPALPLMLAFWPLAAMWAAPPNEPRR